MLKILEARYAAARLAATTALNEYRNVLRAESNARCEKLLKKPLRERFAALEEGSDKLFAVDRRALMRSLKNAAPEKRDIVASTASRFEIWRSRLPYKVFPLIIYGITVAAVVVLAVAAYRHTPQQWVTINADRGFPVESRGPGGQLSEVTVTPGERFVLVRVEAGQGLLRSWVPSEGYSEIRVPAQYLQGTR